MSPEKFHRELMRRGLKSRVIRRNPDGSTTFQITLGDPYWARVAGWGIASWTMMQLIRRGTK